MEKHIRGHWWLPDQTEKVAGVLHLKKNGEYSLVLEGKLLNFGHNNWKYPVDTILGDTFEGLVTLFSCFLKEEVYAGYCKSEEYMTRNVFIGEHFNSRDEVSFKRYHIYFPYLNYWAGFSKFNIDATISQLVTQDEPVYLAKVNDYIFRFSTQLNHEISKHRMVMQEEFYIEVTHSDGTPIQLKDFECNILIISQNFFTFVIGSPVYPLSILGYNQKNHSFKFEACTEIHIDAPYMREENVSSISVDEMILPFTYLNENMNELLNNWFALNKRYLPILDLYFGNIYNTHLYQHNRFLNIMQVLESYHRITFGKGSLMPEDHYSSIKSDIFTLIDSKLEIEYQKDFKEKFNHMNDTTLRKRIRDLIDIHKDTLIVAFNPNSEFIGSIVKARNNMTHLDNREDKQWDYLQISKNLLYITTIFEVCLLSDLGIKQDYIKKILSEKVVKQSD